jgi:mono/diheme cytochrome c family protein
MRRIGYAFAVLAVAAALAAPPAAAKAPYVKKAQDLGHKELVVNCASCHKAKLPTAKDATLNDTLGAWLEKKKKSAGAKEIDLKWLKDYKPQSAK